MKTTLDLPDDLVRAIKIRAVREGRKLKDAVAELLRQGLAAAATPTVPTIRPKISTDPKTGLPLIQGTPGAPISQMNAEEIYDLIHQSQEEEDLGRLGISLRR